MKAITHSALILLFLISIITFHSNMNSMSLEEIAKINFDMKSEIKNERVYLNTIIGKINRS